MLGKVKVDMSCHKMTLQLNPQHRVQHNMMESGDYDVITVPCHEKVATVVTDNWKCYYTQTKSIHCGLYMIVKHACLHRQVDVWVSAVCVIHACFHWCKGKRWREWYCGTDTGEKRLADFCHFLSLQCLSQNATPALSCPGTSEGVCVPHNAAS